MKLIIRTAIALAATTGLALTAAPPALAAAPVSASRDYDDTFEQESANGLATVEGEYAVEGDDEEDNSFVLEGDLYDGDDRTLRQGGRCAYFEVQVASAEHGQWRRAKRVKLCSYDETKHFRVAAYDVAAVRVKTCQVSYRGWTTSRCSRWYRLDLGF
ncbi:hypothetical protein GCM10010517_18200 [Streptosporangium fragile]|uniref:Secreted protein n=1 Tax=Streptosporangium fragile TaxID=46186 RepID=A0ABN3VV74_9ACTN